MLRCPHPPRSRDTTSDLHTSPGDPHTAGRGASAPASPRGAVGDEGGAGGPPPYGGGGDPDRSQPPPVPPTPRAVLMRAAGLYSGRGAALTALGCSRADPTQVRDSGWCAESVPVYLCVLASPTQIRGGPACPELLDLQRPGLSRLRLLPRSPGASWGLRRASLTPRSPAGPRRPPPCPRPGSPLSASVGTRPRRRASAGGGCSHLAVLSPQVRACCCYCCPGSRAPKEPVSWVRAEGAGGGRTGSVRRSGCRAGEAERCPQPSPG